MAEENIVEETSAEPVEQPVIKKIGYFLIGFAILVILAVLSVYISQNKIASVEIGKGWGFERSSGKSVSPLRLSQNRVFPVLRVTL